MKCDDDWQHETMGLAYAKILIRCPACAKMEFATRVFGIGSARGNNWFAFRTHASPCGLPCITGECRKSNTREIHRGPHECGLCENGDIDAGEHYILMDKGAV